MPLIKVRTDEPNKGLEVLNEIRNRQALSKNSRAKRIKKMDTAEEIFMLGYSHKSIQKELNEFQS